MSPADDAASPGPRPAWIADAVLAHFEEFRRSRPSARKVLVSIMLTNNEIFVFDGLRVDRLAWAPDSVMIRGSSDESGDGLDGTIYRAEFEADPPDPERFGFSDPTR